MSTKFINMILVFGLFAVAGILLLIVGCAETNRLVTVNGTQGPAGPQGASCTVVQSEGGAYIACSDETSAFIANGTPGIEGPQGPPGASQGAVLTMYALTSCTEIPGTSYWAKKNGSTVGFYNASFCSSSTKEFEMTEGDSLWVSSTALAVYLSGGFRLIEFAP